jgi:EpsI family protein
MARSSDKPFLRIAVAAGAFLLCYWSVFSALAGQWAANSTYSYRFAVPLISAYIVWWRWSAIKAAYSAPDYRRGGVLLGLGLSMLTIGHLGALMSLEGMSLIPTLAGLISLLAGGAVLRVIWFPLGYLLLMLPVWGHLFRSLEAPSQHLSATIGTWLLAACGIPALQQGTRIMLPSMSLDVLPECSGISQLTALTVMVLPAAYLWLKTSASRAALILLALVTAYLSNGARIAMLGLLTVKGVSVSGTNSPIHFLPGFLTASLAYLIIWGCGSFFSRFQPASRSQQLAPVLSVERRPLAARPWVEAAMLCLLVCAGAAQLLAIPQTRSNTDLQSLPTDIADWTAESIRDPASSPFLGFDEGFLGVYPTPSGQRRFIDMDDQVLRTYRGIAGTRVHLYVGYYGHQESGKELSSDVSRPLQHVSSVVSLRDAPNLLTVREVEQREPDHRRGLVFWYDINGRTVDSLYKAKVYTLWDTLTRWRSNGAVVMLAWDTRDGGSREEALAFAQTLLPVLHHCLPS